MSAVRGRHAVRALCAILKPVPGRKHHHTGWWPVLAWEATLWGLAGVSRGVYLADADAGVARAGAGLVDLDLQARVPLAVVFVGAGGQAAGQEIRIPFGQGFGGVLGVFALYGAAGEGLAVLPLPGLAVQGVRGGGGGEGGDRVAGRRVPQFGVVGEVAGDGGGRFACRLGLLSGVGGQDPAFEVGVGQVLDGFARRVRVGLAVSAPAVLLGSALAALAGDSGSGLVGCLGDRGGQAVSAAFLGADEVVGEGVVPVGVALVPGRGPRPELVGFLG